ncbi:unnamed protein product [Anisakis simplex]|uniref:Secreted protein n=1 Tax=Anisakis simplex TaxID=6269 RepID=A0A0M3JB07_ANISI|nr:unnamed protein product [Anisakis simplex]
MIVVIAAWISYSMGSGELLLVNERPTTSKALQDVAALIEIQGLEFNRADTMEECLSALETSNLPTFPDTLAFFGNDSQFLSVDVHSDCYSAAQ